MNRFELASLARGTVTDRQLASLDSLLTQLRSDKFNRFRLAVGIRPGTPNSRLSKRQASLLLDAIKGGRSGNV